MVQQSLGLIDSHAHIQGREYAGETEAILERARAAGVEQIIVVGGAGDMSSNTAAVALADSFPSVYATVGMHPHDAKDVGAEELARLKELAGPSQSHRRRGDRTRLLLQSLAPRCSEPRLHAVHRDCARNRFADRRA